MPLQELITLFNNNNTHIEIDTVNQKDNGYTDDPNVFTYTILLLSNDDNDIIAAESIDAFSDAEIISVINYFKKIRPLAK